MKLRLTPPGTLVSSLAMAAMAAVLLPVTLMFAPAMVDGRVPAHVDQLPSIGAVTFALFLLGCMGCLVFPAMFTLRTRVTDFEASLPIARDDVLLERSVRLWLTMAVTVWTAAFVIISSQAAGLRIWESLYGARWPWGLFLAPPLLAMAAHAALALLLHAYRPRRSKLRRGDLLLASVVALILVVLPLIFLPQFALLFHAAAIAASYVAIRRLGGQEDEEEAVRPARPGRANDHAGPSEAAWWRLGQVNRVLLRSLVLRPKTAWALVMFPVFALVSALAGFGTGQLNAIVFILIISLTPLQMNLLEGSDALPISRTRVLPWLTLPLLAVVLFVSTVGWLLKTDRPFSDDPPYAQIQLDWDHDRKSPVLEVPVRLWSWATAPVSPIVQAPWGETFEPEPVKALGRATPLINTFDVGPNSTVRFARWQASRALDAAGVHRQGPVLEDRFLPGLDPTERLSNLTRYVLETPPISIPRPSWHRRAIGLHTLLSILAWGILTRIALRSRKPRRGLARQLQAPWATHVSLGFWLFVTLRQLASPSGWARSLYQVTEAWIDQLLGASSLAWSAMALALFAALYTWVLRGFLRTETPPLAKPDLGHDAAPIY